MDAQEIFFKQQLQIIEQAIVSKEDDYEVLQQARLEKGVEENIHSVEKVIGFLSVEESRMKQFGEVRINIAKIYHQKMMALRKKQFEEQLELVKDLENELTQLLDNASAISQEENSQK
nr:protein SUPPRESSOR OF GENE SILENCING 3-like [Arachis hypogaea]